MRSDGSPPPVSLFAAAKVWAKIGLVGFGGPAGQISLMHQELVERRRWIDEERFLHALNYCMLLPGPEAQQLATYIGWLLHRTAGGLVAGVLFVLPGAVAVLLLSILYASARELPAVAALLFGLKAAVLAVVIAAVLRIGRRALTSRLLLAVAAASFVALRFFAVPFPVVVLGAGLLGLLGRGGRGGRGGRSTFAAQQPGGEASGEASAQAAQQGPGPTATDGYSPPTVIDALAARGQLSHTQPSAARAARVLAVGAALWA
ncbi:MAG TPA: chromate transporter, partial [Kofleriaceae bacterium]|nr:chromate transporter [Kofleriaceae bacterium]